MLKTNRKMCIENILEIPLSRLLTKNKQMGKNEKEQTN